MEEAFLDPPLLGRTAVQKAIVAEEDEAARRWLDGVKARPAAAV